MNKIAAIAAVDDAFPTLLLKMDVTRCTRVAVITLLSVTRHLHHSMSQEATEWRKFSKMSNFFQNGIFVRRWIATSQAAGSTPKPQ
jgi:hypothetical protein